MLDRRRGARLIGKCGTGSLARFVLRAAGLAGLLIGSTAGLPGCERSEDRGGVGARVDRSGGPNLNIILVSVDTTRADHLGCYGQQSINTPNIDQLASEGTRFAQCISSSPLTLPSHATMLTGSYQFVHGVRDNGSFQLADENTTLAELLRPAGYLTLAEVASDVLDARYGLNQGFDHYGDVASAGLEGPALQQRQSAEILERKADEMTRRAVELLSDNKDRPFFLFLHYYDPHQRYEAPEPFASRYADGYKAEIAFVDHAFGKLIAAIRTLGLADRTLVVFTSDHGEGLGEHGEDTHSYFLYDTTQHVPLILWSPGRVPAGQVVEAQVRLVDLTPTVLAYVGLSATRQMQGVSLRPLLSQPDRDDHLPCYADTFTTKFALGYSPLRFLRVDGWKYIHAPKPELYHVATDPRELSNLVDREPDRVVTMRERLRALIADAPPPPGSRAAAHPITDDERERLQQLGYVTGADAAEQAAMRSRSELDDFEPVGPNPADHAATIQATIQAKLWMVDGELDKAEAAMRTLYAKEPANLQIVTQFADLLATRRQYDEAIRLYGVADKLLIAQRDTSNASRQAEDGLGSKRAELLLKWGVAYRLGGQPGEAAEKMADACRLDPEQVHARALLSDTLYQLGRRDEAIDQMAKVAEAQPEDPRPLRTLVAWLEQEGNHEGAARYLSRLVALSPEDAAARASYGKHLLAAGRHAEALAQLRRANNMAPENVETALLLVDTLAESGQTAEAVDVCDRLMARRARDVGLYHKIAARLDAIGVPQDAVALLRRGYRLMPDRASLAHDLAWRLATSRAESVRDGAEAVGLLEPLVSAGAPDAALLDTLAASYAASGRFDEAASTARRARSLAEASNQADLADRIAKRLAQYEQGHAYVEVE